MVTHFNRTYYTEMIPHLNTIMGNLKHMNLSFFILNKLALKKRIDRK